MNKYDEALYDLANGKVVRKKILKRSNKLYFKRFCGFRNVVRVILYRGAFMSILESYVKNIWAYLRNSSGRILKN